MRNKKNKIKNFFGKYYSESWDYLMDSRKFIYIIIIIFLFSAMIGFFLPAPDSITQQIFKFIEDLILKTEGMNQFQITKFIFLNNLQSSFTSMIFGIPLGIFPLASTMLNGYLIGFVSAISVKTDGIFILWRLVPHGIFELPALFISLGLGLKLGTFIFQKNKIQSLKKYFRKSLIVFFFVVFPLLILAAIIEGSLISSVG